MDTNEREQKIARLAFRVAEIEDEMVPLKERLEVLRLEKRGAKKELGHLQHEVMMERLAAKRGRERRLKNDRALEVGEQISMMREEGLRWADISALIGRSSSWCENKLSIYKRLTK